MHLLDFLDDRRVLHHHASEVLALRVEVVLGLRELPFEIRDLGGLLCNGSLKLTPFRVANQVVHGLAGLDNLL